MWSIRPGSALFVHPIDQLKPDKDINHIWNILQTITLAIDSH